MNSNGNLVCHKKYMVNNETKYSLPTYNLYDNRV